LGWIDGWIGNMEKVDEEEEEFGREENQLALFISIALAN
jgi:hypothetical protein